MIMDAGHETPGNISKMDNILEYSSTLNALNYVNVLLCFPLLITTDYRQHIDLIY